MVDNVDAWLVAALVALIVAAAVLGAAEAAILRVPLLRVEIDAQSGRKRARTLVRVLDDLPRTLNTVLLVVLLVQISAAAIVGLLAERLFEYLRAQGLGQDRYELQVLMGVRERLWQAWRDAQEPVRVYVPYGPDWRAYSTRRLKKNPQILRNVMRGFFSRR